jgi:exosortase/archaeosortase family protein
MRVPRVSPAALAGLLAVEILALGIAFDTLSLQALGVSWWGRLISRGSLVPHVAVAAATGMAILGARRASTSLAAARAVDARAWRWPYFVAHVLAYIAFVLVTERMLGPGQPTAGKGGWILPWLLAGVATVVTLMLAAVGGSALVAIARRAWPPLAAGVVVGVGAWAAGVATESLWQPLRLGTLLGAFALLRLVRGDAFVDYDAAVVGLPSFSVQILTACSGYEGIGLSLVFVAGFLLAFRRRLRMPQALVLFPIGIATVWLGNLLRVATLVLVGAVSPRIALGGFHSYAGSLLFCVLSLGLVHFAQRWPYVFRGVDTSPEQVRTGETGDAGLEPYLLPLLVVLALALLTSLVNGGAVDWLYPARVVFAVIVCGRYRREYRELLRGGSWIFVPLGLGVFAIWLVLTPSAPARDAALVADLREARPALAAGWLLLRVLGAVAVAPLGGVLNCQIGYLCRPAESGMELPFPDRVCTGRRIVINTDRAPTRAHRC